MKKSLFSLNDLFKTPQQKTYTMLLITVLVVGLMFFLAIKPAYYKIAQINRDIKTYGELLKKIDTKLNNLKYLVSLRDGVKKDMPYFNDALPEKPETGYLVANFAEIAKKYNLVLSSVEFTDKIDDKALQRYSEVAGSENATFLKAKLSLEGDVEGIEEYISYLESFPRVMDVGSVSYTHNTAKETILNNQTSEPFHEYSGQLSVFVFYYNNPEEEQEE